MNTTEKNFLYQFGRKIAAKRKSCSFTQKELAARAGISTAYVASIESGRRWPRLAVHHSMAKALDVKLEQLLEGVVPEKRASANKLASRGSLS
jgi:transcriptional regulator with XRE-family HTH domain